MKFRGALSRLRSVTQVQRGVVHGADGAWHGVPQSWVLVFPVPAGGCRGWSSSALGHVGEGPSRDGRDGCV